MLMIKRALARVLINAVAGNSLYISWHLKFQTTCGNDYYELYWVVYFEQLSKCFLYYPMNYWSNNSMSLRLYNTR